MLELQTKHPSVLKHFLEGDFAVQRKKDQPFSMTPVIQKQLRASKGVTEDEQCVNQTNGY